METMQERQDERMDSLMEKRMKEVFVRWLQENDYDEAAFLEKYSEEELVMQYVIGEERSRIYLADDQGGQAEVLCEFSTDRIGESRDLIGEVTLQASWIAWIAMDKLYGAEHNSLRKLPESADCGLAENIRREYEGLCWQGETVS